MSTRDENLNLKNVNGNFWKVNNMLEALGIIAVALTLSACVWVGLVVAALSEFSGGGKGIFFTGLGLTIISFVFLVTFLCKNLTIA